MNELDAMKSQKVFPSNACHALQVQGTSVVTGVTSPGFSNENEM
jgi:hypothetical protein